MLVQSRTLAYNHRNNTERIRPYRLFFILTTQSEEWDSLRTGNGQFNQLKGLHVDSHDNVFEFDKDGNFISKFDVLNGLPIDVGIDSIDRVFVSTVGNQILIYELTVPTPTIQELIDIINGLGLTSPNALVHPLQHICTDLGMYFSRVDLYEKTGKLAVVI